MMNAYAQAMAVLRGVVCPHCLRAELAAVLHLDDGIRADRTCVCGAHCEQCGENFTVEFAGVEPLIEVQRHVEAGLGETKCAVCGQASYALSLICKQSSNDCYFEARCRVCGTAYQVEIGHSPIDLARLAA